MIRIFTLNFTTKDTKPTLGLTSPQTKVTLGDLRRLLAIEELAEKHLRLGGDLKLF